MKEADEVILIDNSNQKLFWFIDLCGDGLEEVLDENCNVVCITDVEGEVSNQCPSSIFEGTRIVIWKR